MFRFISPPLPHMTVCGEDTYPTGGKHPDRANIGVFDLLIVTNGVLWLEENGQGFTVKAGEFLILRPDRSHRTARPCSEETHFFWLHFQTVGEWQETEEPERQVPMDSGHPFAQVEYFSFYLSRYGKLNSPRDVFATLRQLILLQQETATVSRWQQQILFQELLVALQAEELLAKQNHHLRIAESAASFLRQHYKEPLDYKRLSEEIHFHANYIAICMKKAFGCTPLDYLTRHRVAQAKQMLIHTDEPVGRIAEETGFRSFPYFIRCFGKQTGMKPSEFRSQHRTK
ncbi:helix-turn-helix transcriptional regulator [Paenibacillus sp. GCM10027628]|uniref:helix-turn-helix transcriptional regulator n=1 Tax=Paenibacillus sp. GCM10027628 TaxID=3273413 RepID=UPI003632167D